MQQVDYWGISKSLRDVADELNDISEYQNLAGVITLIKKL
jgi:hypothetical protein